jgi:methanogenic corrinoid protein MtbC1
VGDSRKQALAYFQEKFRAFDIDAIPGIVERMITAGVTTPEFLKACIPCMEEIGQKFENGEYYLSELVMAGEMFKGASNAFRKSLADEVASDAIAGIVLGTPRGDIHDLGKDIFAVLAEASGFEVHNLGVDVPPDAFIRTIRETGAVILGLSTLLTTTFDAIVDTVRMLEGNGLRDSVFVIIGGGATDGTLVEKLQVDAQTRDAYEGLRLIRAYLARRSRESAA